jgi:hypothetical protein
MLKSLIFILPILAILKNTVDRIFLSDKSTTQHIQKINRFGMKGAIIRRPLFFISMASFIGSYWFISLGIFWAIFGVFLLLSVCAFLLIPSQLVTMPEIGSADYIKLLKKRTNESILGFLIALLWVFSWVVT